MAMVRMQMFFTMSGPGSRSAGWSETHYSFTAATLPNALNNLIDLAGARAFLLGAGVTLRYLRVSDDDIFRDSRAVNGLSPNIGPDGAWYNPAFRLQPSDFGYAAAFCRLRGNSDFYARSLYLSGLPDVSQDILHPTPTGAAWTLAFDNYRRTLLGGRYGFKVQQVGGGVGPFQVVSLNAGLFTTMVNHGLNPGDLCSITGFQPKTGQGRQNNPNGRWRVSAVPSATTFGLLNYTQVAFQPTALGRVKKIVYIVTDYRSCTDPVFTKKSRGRPFGLLVGRRRNRARSS